VFLEGTMKNTFIVVLILMIGNCLMACTVGIGQLLPTVEMVQVGETETTYTIPTGIDDNGTDTVKGGYLMATTETTYELWHQVRIWAEANGYHFQNLGIEGNDGTAGAEPTEAKLEPVTTVSWRDVVVWSNAISEMFGYKTVYRTASDEIIRDSRDANGSVIDLAIQTSNNGFRLPTSMEWEMAARWKNDTSSINGSILVGGRYWTPGRYASGASTSYLLSDATRAVAWYSGASGGNFTRPVGQLLPNHLGIYDMSGNVGEWTYTTSGLGKVVRGGIFFLGDLYLQVGYIINDNPAVGTPYPDTNGEGGGFRLVRSP
jgi:formylglycine-generating enzyme required for sulfatase activity